MAQTATERISKALQNIESTDSQQPSQRGSRAISREELKEVVKAGVKEGLDEHHREMKDSKSSEQSGDSSGHPLLRVLGGAAVLAFLAYMRRRRSSGSDMGTDQRQETTIETTPDGGRATGDEGDKFAGDSR